MTEPLTKETMYRGERWCTNGVDHNGEPTKAKYVRADWADARIADYEEVLADHRRLVRGLDVLINGDGAAKQASLCDIVAQLAVEKGKRASEPPGAVLNEVWIASSKTFSAAFATEKAAHDFLSSYPPSVSGGISVDRFDVIGSPPKSSHDSACEASESKSCTCVLPVDMKGAQPAAAEAKPSDPLATATFEAHYETGPTNKVDSDCTDECGQEDSHHMPGCPKW